MNKDRTAGAAKQAEEAIKEATGKGSGDPKLTVEGRGDKVKGAARKAVSGVKDALRTWSARPAPANTDK